MRDLYQGIKHKIDFRTNARELYEVQVVSKTRVLDIGGRNSDSKSRRRINLLNQSPQNTIVSTDIIADYKPDLVDDICNTNIKPNTFDGIYCDAILDHVKEYWIAIHNIHTILDLNGEVFIYMSFIFAFHDLMDYHFFTFTEVERMLNVFFETKILLPGNHGFCYVLWYVLTFGLIMKFSDLHAFLTWLINSVLNIILFVVYNLNRTKINQKYSDFSCDEFQFYFTRLHMNHGFCAWAKK
jgi:hypothetical protein